jgi:hypothetical protein
MCDAGGGDDMRGAGGGEYVRGAGGGVYIRGAGAIGRGAGGDMRCGARITGRDPCSGGAARKTGRVGATVGARPGAAWIGGSTCTLLPPSPAKP